MKNSAASSSFLLKVIVGAISVFLADFLLMGVHLSNWISALVLVLVIILINFTIKPLLVLLTLPVSLLTFGLFLLVINAIVILLAAEMTQGFTVDGFWWAFGFALILSVINSMLGISLSLDSKAFITYSSVGFMTSIRLQYADGRPFCLVHNHE